MLIKRVLLGRDPAPVDRWFLCGPLEMSKALRDSLIDQGIDENRVHVESFGGCAAPTQLEGLVASDVTITLRGTAHDIRLDAGETVLAAAVRNDIDAPYACMGGACGTCAASITTGQVRMEQNVALDSAEVRAGRVLTCQSRPPPHPSA